MALGRSGGSLRSVHGDQSSRRRDRVCPRPKVRYEAQRCHGRGCDESGFVRAYACLPVLPGRAHGRGTGTTAP